MLHRRRRRHAQGSNVLWPMPATDLALLGALALHVDMYPFELTEETGLRSSTCCAALHRLRHLGLVTRQRLPRDHRGPFVLWRASAAGLRVMRAWFRFLEDVGPLREKLGLYPGRPSVRVGLRGVV